MFRWVKRLVGCFVFGVYDYGRFSLHSSDPIEIANRRQYEAILTKQYHRIEKGLCMPNFRPLFGQKVVKEIVDLMEKEVRNYPDSDDNIYALECLQGYIDLHTNSNFGDDDFIAFLKLKVESIFKLIGTSEELKPNGFSVLSGSELNEIAANCHFDQFARSRHSIREFDQRPIPPSIIEEALEDALFAPSVCNRQGWRCHYVQGRALIDDCLSLQSGNRGFGDQVPGLLVVTAEIRAFVGPRERYQPWIDGGLFSMALMYALHGRGLGSCPLNWSAPIANDQMLRKKLNLPASETVIMMLAVGYIPDSLRVCRSARRNTSDIFALHKSGEKL